MIGSQLYPRLHDPIDELAERSPRAGSGTRSLSRAAGLLGLSALALLALAGCGGAPEARATGASEEASPGSDAPADQEAQEEPELGFFITSVGLGDGANLGGLEGADAHCQALAEAVGAGHRTWRAYLSTQATDGHPVVNARDRIGQGPWHNAKGHLIASDLDDLHYNNAAINYEHALDENGETVASGALGDPVTHHDILTGTRLDGTAFPPGEDRTCSNWTSDGEGSAMVGHHDRYRFRDFGSPWNAAHPSRGCGQENLEGTGGAGLFYCFAAE